MIAIGEDELICDFAETYGIYDIRALPASTIAVLAGGLGSDSRIKRKIAKRVDEADIDTILEAQMVDLLALLVWSKTEDAEHNRNRPQSITNMLLKRGEQEQKKELKSFRTPEKFMEAWKAAGGGA